MGTRAAAFTVKIRNLQDFYTRIQHGIQPLPSGIDVANTLKYFSQTLLSVLKDVPNIPLSILHSPQKDHYRTSLFPSLDYKSLYHIIVQLVDGVPLVQTGAHVMGQTILHALSCLLPFLEHEYMDTLPYIVASSMAIFPASLHQDILVMLCHRLLPCTFLDSEDLGNQSYANMSTSAILMMVFQYTDNTAFHCQLVESLMSIKRDVVKDLLSVIAYGTAKARGHAVELLFKYWPTLNLALHDKKGLNLRLNGSLRIGWKPLLCQQGGCSLDKQATAEAVKMCFEHSVSISCAEKPPPLFLCQGCAEQVRQEHGPGFLVDMLLPLSHVSLHCENKNCKAADTTAIVTCFSPECAGYNGNQPVRLCQQCHVVKHSVASGEKHIVQLPPCSPWEMDPETQIYMVEAIVSLLQEARPSTGTNSKERNEEGPRPSGGRLESEESSELSGLEERPLLSRYGVWLMVGLATPVATTPTETLGRLLSMLFQWFHYTACLPDDQAGNALERLKTEYVQEWMMKVIKTHFDVFVSCLLPHPADYARVGGHWDTWPNHVNSIKEGFKRLLCIVPYDIITPEVWEHIMPYWMESFRYEIPEEELSELKILLSKVLDPDLSPLGFQPAQMYCFLSIRFEGTLASVQEQALNWLQILTLLEVPIPLGLLFSMFTSGVNSLAAKPAPPARAPPLSRVRQKSVRYPPEERPESELCLLCYILMLDILIKQMELQEVALHKGLEKTEGVRALQFLLQVLRAPWEGQHVCGSPSEEQCTYCQLCGIAFQLVMTLVEFHAPPMAVSMADVPSDSAPAESRPLKKGSLPLAEQMEGLLTAVVQECGADIAAILEPVETVTATAVTLTEDDTAGATCTVTQANLVDEHDHAVPPQPSDDFWATSQGRFKFVLEELPLPLQLTFALLKSMAAHKDADVLYHVLSCLKLLCLHAEVLNRAAHEHRGFLIWCQENLLISNLWELLQLQFSQLSQLAVALLLHCTTLPSGADMFWRLVEHDFHSDSWRDRFAAVEKVTMIGHFAEPAAVKNSPLLQSSLATAFCYLVWSLRDIQPCVAQRAVLLLDSIKTSALKLLVWCLEVQFDTVIADRAMILQTVLVLFHQLSGRRFLSWDFFLNRLDTLFVEAQLALDMSFTRDLKNSNHNSEIFQRKLTRAHEALAQAHSSRSLTASFGPKWPYKRAMSAPGGMVSQRDKWVEKVYNRQSSAPVLKRKSSKMTGGGPSIQHLPNSFFTEGQGGKEQQIQEESHFLQAVHLAAELEDCDHDTRHLLVFLLMQFLARPDPSHPAEEKSMARNQKLLLRHLNILLGYSPTEKGFYLPPHKLRASPVFSAFLTCMPKVLDCNFKLGTILLGTCLPLLVYCPSGHRAGQWGNQTLWLLPGPFRRAWLLAVIVILYKYDYDSPSFSKQVVMLVHTILNTLSCHHHHCRHGTAAPTTSPIPSRSRDLSATSVELENIHEPPEVLVSAAAPPKLPAEDSPSSEELEAIPESPKSEPEDSSIVEKSNQESMEKVHRTVAHAEESSQPEYVENDDILTVTYDSTAHSSEVKMTSELPKKETSSEPKKRPVEKPIGLQATPIVPYISKPSLERLLPIGPLPTRRHLQECCYESDKAVQTTILGMEIPALERLLPVGPMPSRSTTPSPGTPASHKAKWSLHDIPLESPVHHRFVFPSPPATSTPTKSRWPAIEMVSKMKDFDLASSITTSFSKPASPRMSSSKPGSPKSKPGSPKSRSPDHPPLHRVGRFKIPKPIILKEPPSPSHRASTHKKSESLLMPVERPPLQRAASTGFCTEEPRPATGERSPLQRASSTGLCDSLHESPEARRDDEHRPTEKAPSEDGKCRPHFKQRKQKKPFPERGLDPHTGAARHPGEGGFRRSRRAEAAKKGRDDPVQHRCSQCGVILQEYADEEIGLCLVALSALVHRRPSLAAGLLPDMLRQACRVASHPCLPDPNIFLPGGAVSVARQFIRCTLHQLAPNGIFVQIFNSHFSDNQFFKIMAQTLLDFADLGPLQPLLLLIEDLNERKQLTHDAVYPTLANMAAYMECLPLESAALPWATLLPQMEIFLRKLLLTPPLGASPPLSLLCCLMRTPAIANFKSLLDPVSKVMSQVLQMTVVSSEELLALCHACNKAFSRDRDKQCLTRTAVFELVQALKFKTQLPDKNLLMLIQFVLQDAGGWLGPSVITEVTEPPQHSMYNTGAAECMRQHLGDALEFIVDVHALSKIKSNSQSSKLNEETVGGEVKAGIAQYVAIEMSRGRDSRAVSKWLPWLYTLPSSIQQGPKEFTECVSHIRLLSWLLLGSLLHNTLNPAGNACCQPLALEAHTHLIDHILLVLAGFSEQAKTSVLHMAALFHAFILCQLWTLYCEHMLSLNPPGSDQHQLCTLTLLDFWTRVTPGILQLIGHSRAMSDMVSLHFLMLMEALLECNSAVLARLLPMWSQVLGCFQGQLPAAHLCLRLQACLAWPPPQPGPARLRWLRRLHFKMGQIELQASAAATQFYTL